MTEDFSVALSSLDFQAFFLLPLPRPLTPQKGKEGEGLDDFLSGGSKVMGAGGGRRPGNQG